ncbi:MAG TPA: hypothetical protein VE690_18055, partial [Rhodopila sp.]|nr:hypothetical protein [Rhodopila sp.]
LAYLDLRAVSGVRSQYGGFGGLGTLGSATDSTLAIASGSLSSLPGNTLVLTKDNSVQTSSFGVSPYLVHRFGDWGSGRIGYSLDVSRSDTLSGFAAAPFPSGGVNGQSLVSNEETAHYQTGEILSRLTDSVDIDLLQRQARTDSGFRLANGLPASSGIADYSTRTVVFNTVTYALHRDVALFAAGGHEDISYSGGTLASIHDLIWKLGTTLTPNPDSQVTVSYGHQNGFNSLSVEGHYALTARTMLTASYGSDLGTQLETVQTQLNLAAIGSPGSLIDARSNTTVFGNVNLLPVQEGVFRTTTLALGSRTTLDRDIISFSFLTAEQSSGLAGVQSAQSKLRATTAGGSWIHQMRPDMTISTGLSLTWQYPTGYGVGGPGRNTSIVASVGWQTKLSETLTAGVRYTLLNRQAQDTSYTVFQNLLIFGVTKTF